jgi:hypothetical protein
VAGVDWRWLEAALGQRRSEIVYINLDGDLMAVAVDTHTGFQIGTPRRLFASNLAGMGRVRRSQTLSRGRAFTRRRRSAAQGGHGVDAMNLVC